MNATELDTRDIFAAFFSWHEIAELIESRRADNSVWRRGLEHPEAQVRREAAHHFRSRTDIMELAADDVHNEVRQVAATSSATPPEVLAGMIRDRSRVVRECVAKNANTPVHALERLAYDDAWEVRWLIAPRQVSTAAIEHLSRDPSVAIRERVAWRPDLPPHICLAMAGDDSHTVRAITAKRQTHQAVYEALADDRSTEVMCALASNPCISRPLAMRISAHPERTVRAALAQHTDYDDVLELLADDKELTVRAAVATNSALPTHAAIRMLGSQSGLLKRSVLATQIANLPDDLVTQVLDEQLGNPRADIRAELRRLFADRITPRVITSPPELHDRRGLLEVVDQRLPYEFIADALHSDVVPVRVRAALLQHPLVPRGVIEQFTRHPNITIRIAAQQPRLRYLP